MITNSSLFTDLKSDKKVTDAVFNAIYPNKLKEAAEIHFTPIEVAKIAARYLVDNRDSKILDLGSGAGKFCMIGSACTIGHFCGVELRKNLSTIAERIKKHYQLTNVTFINNNIINIDFSKFDAFYIYNPFYEHIVPSGQLDDKIELKRELYEVYSLYVKNQLDKMPENTKLVTYFSYLKEIPGSFKLQSSDFDDKLKMWKKV
jgi:Histone methylation protein DOT1